MLLFWFCCQVVLFFFLEATLEMKVGMLCRMRPESQGDRKPCGLRYLQSDVEHLLEGASNPQSSLPIVKGQDAV